MLSIRKYIRVATNRNGFAGLLHTSRHQPYRWRIIVDGYFSCRTNFVSETKPTLSKVLYCDWEKAMLVWISLPSSLPTMNTCVCVYVSLLSLCAKINSSLRGSRWRNLTLLFIPVHPIQPGLEPMGKRMTNPWPGRYSREKTAAPQACSLWYSCYRQFIYIPTLSRTFKTEHFALVNRKNIAWCLRKMVISWIWFGFSLLSLSFYLPLSFFLTHWENM